MPTSPESVPKVQLTPKAALASLLTSMIRASMKTCCLSISSFLIISSRASNSSERAVMTRLFVDLSGTTLTSFESTMSFSSSAFVEAICRSSRVLRTSAISSAFPFARRTWWMSPLPFGVGMSTSAIISRTVSIVSSSPKTKRLFVLSSGCTMLILIPPRLDISSSLLFSMVAIGAARVFALPCFNFMIAVFPLLVLFSTCSIKARAVSMADFGAVMAKVLAPA